MFTGFPIKTTVPTTASNSSKRNIVFVPITSRRAIQRNRSSGYKTHHGLRSKQLNLLRSHILEDDNEWRMFHHILQQEIDNKAVSTSTVKALLFDAIDTFHKNNSFSKKCNVQTHEK